MFDLTWFLLCSPLIHHRHVQILLVAVCRLTLAFPTQTTSAFGTSTFYHDLSLLALIHLQLQENNTKVHFKVTPWFTVVGKCTELLYSSRSACFYFPADDVRQLQVNIPHSGPVSAPLGSSISIPCLVSLSSIPTSSSSAPVVPRVKWTVVSGGVETQILVARGQRVKLNEAYRDRAAWLNYTSSPDELSLWLGDLRSSDSGHYRCEVQQGLEDADDLAHIKVKGEPDKGCMQLIRKKLIIQNIHRL